ncbi:hypothetical protein SODG_006630 [Sodalis praecaptivus]|nr:hypothetical protein NVIRENTERO_03177 [Sodalis praecaptivus]
MPHAVEQVHDSRFRANGGGDILHGRRQRKGFHRQQDHIVVVRQVAGLNKRGPQHYIAAGTDNLQTVLAQCLRPRPSHQKGHVASGFGQTAAEIPAGRAGTHYQYAHCPHLIELEKSVQAPNLPLQWFLT